MDAIVLASSSPRRQQVLKAMGIPFVVNPPNIDEILPSDIKIEDGPEYLAAKKVEAVTKAQPIDQEIPWILGADTAIILDGQMIGKPKDEEDAKSMLKKIQGKTHKVITGIALFNGFLHYLATRTSVNTVTFNNMSDKEIDWYLQTGEWHGAAGAYRIQGMASCFIKKIEGSESSVMGLPIFELYDILREQGYTFLG